MAFVVLAAVWTFSLLSLTVRKITETPQVPKYVSFLQFVVQTMASSVVAVTISASVTLARQGRCSHHRFLFEYWLWSVVQFFCPILHAAGLKWNLWPTAGFNAYALHHTSRKCRNSFSPRHRASFGLLCQLTTKQTAAVMCSVQIGGRGCVETCREMVDLPVGSVWASWRLISRGVMADWKELCRVGGGRSWLQTGVHRRQRQWGWNGTASSR